MRRGGLGVLVLFCVCLGGCLSGDPGQSTNWLERLRVSRGVLGPDGVQLQMVVLEKPLGDNFLNDELWRSTDCQVVGLAKKSILDDNGFCIGLVVGMNPEKLQTMLSCKRSWVGDRDHTLPIGTAAQTMPISPIIPLCNFRLRTEEVAKDVEVRRGECVLRIEPTLAADGRTKLKFTPVVLYGDKAPDYEAAPENFGWSFQYKQLCIPCPELSWEVTVAPNQFLVIGTHFDENAVEDAPQSLGSRFFLADTGRMFMQRVLVLRTIRRTDALAEMPGSQYLGQPSEHGDVSQSLPVVPAAACIESSYHP
jgi:hypothetical protein